jgi:hypothetical protein
MLSGFDSLLADGRLLVSNDMEIPFSSGGMMTDRFRYQG